MGLLTEAEYVTARRKLLGRKVKSVRPRTGNDLPVLFALAALALVAAAAAIYFLAMAK